MTGIIWSIFSDHNGMELEITWRKKKWEINKYVEIKQHATEQQKDQRRNKKRNLKTSRRTKLETYQNFRNAAKAILKRKCIVIDT